MADAITDALPAPNIFFNSCSNHGGRPSGDHLGNTITQPVNRESTVRLALGSQALLPKA